MNPRIKELAEEAVNAVQSRPNGICDMSKYNQKFAELIIQECANFALREDHDPSDCILNHFGVER
jgi:hypothetical protein